MSLGRDDGEGAKEEVETTGAREVIDPIIGYNGTEDRIIADEFVLFLYEARITDHHQISVSHRVSNPDGESNQSILSKPKAEIETSQLGDDALMVAAGSGEC